MKIVGDHPAYAVPHGVVNPNFPEDEKLQALLTHHGGLTIRAQLAAMAMQGFLANGDFVAPLVAKRAVEMADMLIDELNKEEPKKQP